MEKNAPDFVVDPKRDFVRKSELSFSKTIRFINRLSVKAAFGKGTKDIYSRLRAAVSLYLFSLIIVK